MTSTATGGPATRPGRQLLIKVPEVTAYFWVIKVLATAMGETTADFLVSVQRLGMKGALALTSALLLVSIAVQWAARRYVPAIYWTAVVMVSIAGTLITDTIVRRLGVSHLAATAGFSIALLALFVVWYAVEGTLSFHSIHTRRREAFYWAAVLVTFALGTAAGDLTALSLGWGFPASIVLYAAVIAVAALARLRLRANLIATFWIAYVVTRPLGASVADYLGLPRGTGALDLGLWQVSLGFLAPILALVGYLAVTRRDAPADDPRSTDEPRRTDDPRSTDDPPSQGR